MKRPSCLTGRGYRVYGPFEPASFIGPADPTTVQRER